MNTLMKNRSITERNTSMNSLYLSDIMRRVNLVPDKVKLIRQIYDEEFAEYYESGHMKDYFSIMSSNFSEDYDYWLVFLAEDKGYATFLMCYKVGEAVKATRNQCPRSFLHPEVFNGRHKYFKLKETDIMDDLTERLIIDWGSGKRSWHQKGTIEKRVVAIKTDSKPFPGFLDIFVTYEELREIINEPIRYSNWQDEMFSVNAIYLITDTKDGRMYVGSTSGRNGLLGRWRNYVRTKHGGNKELKEKLERHPRRYLDFKFSVLEVLPKDMDVTEIHRKETLWKEKLKTKEYGMNSN